MSWIVQAPANIALIKYMGKQDTQHNLPANPSLSYTLPTLTSSVKLTCLEKGMDCWAPWETESNLLPLQLTSSAQLRFIKHLGRIKSHFAYPGSFLIQSANNFPQAVGIASSASSFAALTQCASQALCELTGSDALSIDEQARLSRLGSGSSCRSFYAPWCLWDGDGVSEVTTPFPELIHQVIVFDRSEKRVSSSEAHQRVLTSPDYHGRAERAKARLHGLLEALQCEDWRRLYQISYEEFMDMHQLFSTAANAFSYMTNDCREVLATLQQYWADHHDGPLITMDAGTTIHLLYRPDQATLALRLKNSTLKLYDVL